MPSLADFKYEDKQEAVTNELVAAIRKPTLRKTNIKFDTEGNIIPG